MKTIQDTNYITAVGFDYQKGRFHVFSQMLDFSNVAKSESGKMGGSAAVWVGEEEGDTVGEAFNKLYKTSQQRVFWAHVAAFVFSDEAIRQGVSTFTDGFARYNETRFTQWVFSTQEPIDRLFRITPFFNLSPMASILAQPVESFQQRSFIPPVRLYKVIANVREPGSKLMLPSLEIQKDGWKKNGKSDLKLEISGIYATNAKEDVEWLSESQLQGLRWMQTKTSRTPLFLEMNGKRAGTVSIHDPKSKIKPKVQNDQVVFDIDIKCKAVVTELLIGLDDATLKKQAAKQITDQVEQTFETGKSHGVDVYQLEHVLYRKDFPDWSQLTDKGVKPLKEFKINRINVEVNIMHSGMYKMKEKRKQY